MALFIDLAFRARRLLFRVLHLSTHGVKVAAFDQVGRLLLVRHRYGDTERLMLPGGGIKRGETPEAAARRELAEETGCKVGDLQLIAVYRSRAEGRNDTIHFYRGGTPDRPEPDGFEIATADFYSLADLPDAVSQATRRRIDELTGACAIARKW